MTVAAPKLHPQPARWLDNPIIRREGIPRRLRRASGRTWMALAAAAAGGGLLAGALVVRLGSDAPADTAQLTACAWAGISAFVAIIEASRCIVQERLQGTWDALVITRLGARRIVFGKLLSILLPLWVLGLALLPMLVLLTVMSQDPARIAWVLLWAYAVGTIGTASFASLGLYCSMRCRTMGGAQFATFGILFVMFQVLPLAFTYLTLYVHQEGPVPLAWVAGIPLPGFLALLDLVHRFDRLDKAVRR